MSHTSTDPSKLTSLAVSGTINTIHSNLQAALRSLAAGDKIISVDMVKSSSGKIIAYVTFEDQ